MRTQLLFPLLFLASTHAAFAQQEPYKLQPGDAVELWVGQEEQLNRRVSIGPDGRLSLPLVGQVVAQGMTIEDLSKAFKERLQKYYSEDLDITVMLQPNEIHARSIFVAGDVTNPGVFPYRPDMTVMHVVSVAGGLYRAAFVAADQDRSTMLRGDIARTQSRVNQLSATVARLEAELANSPKIDEAQPELRDVPPDALKAVVAQEQAILDMRMDELRIKEASEKQLKDIAVRGLDAAKEQLQSVDTRIGLANQRLEATNSLISKGFSQGSQRLDLESTIAEMQGEKSEYSAAVATQEAALVNSNAGMEAFLQERKTQLLTDLNATKRERDALVTTLADSVKALKVYDDATTDTEEAVTTYTLLRTKDGQTEEIPASELTPVEPGDLIRVSKVITSRTSSIAGD